MKLIAHRGNINGPSKMANKPSFIVSSLRLGYDVEIDVWYEKSWWLGHDEPQYEIDLQWLYEKRHRLWVHCKNWRALDQLNNTKSTFRYFSINYFWHQNDDYTITSKGFPWVYPGKRIMPGCVCVLPENSQDPYETDQFNECYGVCSDFIERYKKL
jgi:hypothetical protein